MVSKHKTYLLPGRNEGRSKSTFRQLRISTLWTSKGYTKVQVKSYNQNFLYYLSVRNSVMRVSIKFVKIRIPNMRSKVHASLNLKLGRRPTDSEAILTMAAILLTGT